MSEQLTPANNERVMQDQTYTVQRGITIPDEGQAWEDIARVTVPARTHRKTVVEKALTEAGITPEVGQQMQVRVLDADSARSITVGSVQPPAQLVIGDA